MHEGGESKGGCMHEGGKMRVHAYMRVEKWGSMYARGWEKSTKVTGRCLYLAVMGCGWVLLEIGQRTFRPAI